MQKLYLMLDLKIKQKPVWQSMRFPCAPIQNDSSYVKLHIGSLLIFQQNETFSAILEIHHTKQRFIDK